MLMRLTVINVFAIKFAFCVSLAYLCDGFRLGLIQ